MYNAFGFLVGALVRIAYVVRKRVKLRRVALQHIVEMFDARGECYAFCLAERIRLRFAMCCR